MRLLETFFKRFNKMSYIAPPHTFARERTVADFAITFDVVSQASGKICPFSSVGDFEMDVAG